MQNGILLSLLVLSVGCGKPQKTSHPAKMKVFNPQQMEVQLANQSITCSDKEFCPEGVARMFSINFDDNNKNSQCSAFLIAPDLVMTNSHCVVPVKDSVKEACKGIYFSFPTPHGETHSAQCAEVIWRDKRIQNEKSYKFGVLDFALIRLDRNVPITPLKLKAGSMKPGDVVYPTVTDHIDAYVAKITRLECRVSHVNRMGIAKLENCPIIGGNSGAAVMDEDQNVVGIIFASSNPKIRHASDELELRKTSQTVGEAFTADQILKTLGSKLP